MAIKHHSFENFLDGNQLSFGSDDDMRIYGSGSTNFIISDIGDLSIQQKANDKDIIFKCDDGSGGTTAYLTLDGSAGYTKAHKHILYEDDAKAMFGTGGDMQILHDGSNTYISQNVTGNLYIQQNTNDADLILQCDDGSGGTTAYLTLDGSAVETKFNKDLRVIDNEKIIAGTSNDLEIFSSGADVIFKTWSGNMTFQQNHDDSDIIFQCDDGSGGVTPYLTLDGSAETVEVAKPLNITGDTAITGNLTVTSGTSGDATLIISADTDNSEEADSPRLWFKADGDITQGAIQHNDNTFDFISNVSANGGFRFLTGTTNNTGTTDPSNGATERVSIDSTGVTVSGNIELGHASDTTIARSAAGTVTIEGKTVATTNKTVAFFNSQFFNSSTSGFYAPFNYLFEQTSLSTSSYFSMISAPYDGKVLRVSSFTQSTSSKTTTVEMYLNGDDSDLTNDQVGTDLVISSYTQKNTGTCADDWVFSAGDALSFRITNSAAASGQVLTFVIEFDLDT